MEKFILIRGVSMIKQVIVVRKDLNMRKGKLAAQVAHASMKIFFDKNISPIKDILYVRLTQEMKDWLHGLFTKIIVGCNSEEELDNLYKLANEAELPCCMIIDSGLTEFNNQPTKTCIAIGPANSKEIDEITGS